VVEEVGLPRGDGPTNVAPTVGAMRASRTNGGLDRPPLIDAVMVEPATEVSAFGVPAGTVTLLLTDVEGWTELWEDATAAPDAQRAVLAEDWPAGAAPRVRSQVPLSGTTAEPVAGHLPYGTERVDLGVRRLRGLGRA
jgi:hypothetical protein